MDLSKINALIDFVGRTNVTELAVTEKDVTVRIFRTTGKVSVNDVGGDLEVSARDEASFAVNAPVFGVLHRSSAPGQEPFVKQGDAVEEGQTLFIIEAMKVFNKISAPRSGRLVYLTDIDGGEIETGDLLAEIA